MITNEKALNKKERDYDYYLRQAWLNIFHQTSELKKNKQKEHRKVVTK